MERILPGQQSRRFLALLLATILVFFITDVSAQETHYTDVESGAWYEQAASELLKLGALDTSESRLRPNDMATRAEVLKLLVNVYGEELVSPSAPSFKDVPKSAWYYPYVETSASAGWVKGDNNCYGTSATNCTARPADPVNRAEMAALLKRAFLLTRLNLAPAFPDVDPNAWYFDFIQTAADRCILQGDGGTGLVRPSANMNRAEMIVMFYRASQQMRYGQECAEPVANIDRLTVVGNDMLRVTFTTDLDPNRMDDLDRYLVETTGGADVEIDTITVNNARIIEIKLGTALVSGTTYRLMVDDMLTEGGTLFSDTMQFESDDAEAAAAEIKRVTVTGNNKVRVEFTTDLDETRADDASRYELERVSGTGAIDVQTAVVLNDTSVDLTLAANLANQIPYRLNVMDLRTADGADFSDTFTFTRSGTSQSGGLVIETATALSATRIRLEFSSDIEESRAEELIRYRIEGPDGELGIDSVGLTDDNIVEIVLDDPLQNQEEYTVKATNLRTADGTTFSDDIVFIYGASNVALRASLSGSQEVPAVVTAASGSGTFTLTPGGLQYDITLKGLSGSVITGGHFHLGDTGIEGAVIEPITFTNLRATGTWTALTADERENILDGNVYVNVHTNAYSDGEIRGQIEKVQ